jgi:hypothetical protein
MTFSNNPLQVGVEYLEVARSGAFKDSTPHNIDTFTFSADLADLAKLPYGQAIAYGSDKGATIPVSGVTTVADVAGFLPYKNNGVVDEVGIQKGGLYNLVPVFNFGQIYAPVTTGEVMVVGDAVSLNLAAGADFNTVRKLPGAPAASDLDISTIATVSEKSDGGFVLLTINKYLK